MGGGDVGQALSQHSDCTRVKRPASLWRVAATHMRLLGRLCSTTIVGRLVSLRSTALQQLTTGRLPGGWFYFGMRKMFQEIMLLQWFLSGLMIGFYRSLCVFTWHVSAF